jgi:LysR family nitrogen assimilation transcriptional regulator
LELRQLKYFIAISDSGSFSKAAEQAHVVQSALSQQIAALETELEVQLLVRSPRGITLTAAGQLFYQQAQHLLRQVEHVKAQVREGEGRPGGPVSIGLPNTTAAQLSLPLLQTCLKRYPGVALHIMEGMSRQLHRAVTNASVDMVIQFSGQAVHGLKTDRLATEELFLISSAPGQAQAAAAREVGEVSLDQLRQMPLLLPERGNGLRDLLDKALLDKGVEITPLAELGSAARLAEAAIQGVGATLLPWGSFHQAHADGKLRVQRIRGLPIRRDLLLCISSSMPLTDAASAVHALVLEVVQDVIRTGIWQAPEPAVARPPAAAHPGP